MNFFDHKDLGNHLLQLCPKVVKHPVCRTAQLNSRRCILNIYSTNILTEYFEHAAHSPFFLRCHLFHNGTFFGSCNIHILNTECAKILMKIPAPKGYRIPVEEQRFSTSPR